MVFEIDSALVPIDAEHMTVAGVGIPVAWAASQSPAVGWTVGKMKAEKP